MSERWQARLVAHGALIFLLGMLGGFPLAFVLLGKIVLWPIPGAIEWTGPGDVRGWRMAHLEGILNGLLLFAVAAVGPRIRLTARQAAIVGWSLIVTAWGNILASLIGPMFGGRGLAFGGGVSNSLMYLLFVAAIVGVMVALWIVFRAARATVARLGD